MLSDRGLLAKVLAAGAILAGLMVWSAPRMNEFHPSISDCRESPERYRGRDIFVGAVVRSVGEGEVWVLEQRTPVRVLGAPRGLRVGDRVSFRGAFVPPDALQPTRWRLHPGYAWKRPVMYVVSILALGWVGWLFHRRYRLRPGLPAFIPRG